MRRRFFHTYVRPLALTAFLTLGFLHLAYAGTTGKISGKIVDAKSKEPLIGVNVLITGTSMGAATDIDGNYTILNIPPNTYTLKATLLGYGPVTVNTVRVSLDLTTKQDFELTESAVEQEEVVIVAERPIIQKDLTAKTSVVGAEQIAALPVTEVSQIVSLQAGFVAGSLRGGRAGEVAYWIDGVPVTDVYNGNQVVEVNKNSIQELQVISGAFNAEYGQALSGVVNIATKEGGQTLAGAVGIYGGSYITDGGEIFPGLDKFRPTSIRNIEGNLSGPLISDHLSFFATGRYIYYDGWLHGYRRFNPYNIGYMDITTNTYHISRDSSGFADSANVPMNSTERAYGQGKITWKITPEIKLSGNYIRNHEVAQAYNQLYFYNPDGIGSNHNLSNTWIFQLSHSLNSNMFYTLGVSFFNTDLKYYLYENPYDPRYVHPALFSTADALSFYNGGTDLTQFHRSTNTMLAKIDLSYQVSQVHLLKVGTEYRSHKVNFENFQLQPIQSQSAFDPLSSSPYITTQIPELSSLSHDYYEHRPKEFSAYVQDKMEFKELIINVGVRFDYFQPDGKVLTDESDPSIYEPSRPSNIFHDLDGDGIQDPGESDKTVEERRAYWYRPASSKSQFSPRIGASFPITAGGVVHFSYGHFFQIPRFERLYENPDFKLGFGTGSQGLVGNADLEAEQTINGELGIQQQIGNDISVDVTAYLRDIRNLAGSRSEEILVFDKTKSYQKYVNSDFGYVRGIVLTLNKRFSGGISATIDYTYQVARGSASDPTETRNAKQGGSLPEVQLLPLGWDQRQTLNVTASYANETWGLSAIGQYGSGTPYTPDLSNDVTTIVTNTEIKPATVNVDMRANYNIPLDALKLVLFARVFNLLDTRNEIQVFNDTGRAGYTTQENDSDAKNASQIVNTVDQWFTRPTFYNEPRRIEIGMNVEF